jgi:hypothetical protein
MNIKDLSAACSEFHSPIQVQYFLFHRRLCARILAEDLRHQHIIVDFVKPDLKDSFFPFTKVKYRCSEAAAEKFILAQSKFFSLSFEHQEYKNLGPLDFTPFVVADTFLRAEPKKS